MSPEVEQAEFVVVEEEETERDEERSGSPDVGDMRRTATSRRRSSSGLKGAGVEEDGWGEESLLVEVGGVLEEEESGEEVSLQTTSTRPDGTRQRTDLFSFRSCSTFGFLFPVRPRPQVPSRNPSSPIPLPLAKLPSPPSLLSQLALSLSLQLVPSIFNLLRSSIPRR